MPKTNKDAKNRKGSLGFEKELWDAADLLRGNMDPAEYKHVVLGLLFLKYISDAFEDRRRELRELVADPDSDYYLEDPDAREKELGYLLEERDEYTLAHVFWVPEEARWEHLRAQAKTETIDKDLDVAMDAIEKENPRLKGVLPKIYARPGLDKDNLGKLIDQFSNVGVGGKKQRAKDVLGRVYGRIYEDLLRKFSLAEGMRGGEAHTPKELTQLMVECLAPEPGMSIYDPACGTGGTLLAACRYLKRRRRDSHSLTLYGQELNPTTWAIGYMNCLAHGVDASIEQGDSLREPKHLTEENPKKTKTFDRIVANPPFSLRNWGYEVWENGDAFGRDAYGCPPRSNADMAFVQHVVASLNSQGKAIMLLPLGVLSRGGSERRIRRGLLQNDLIEAIFVLPPKLFHGTSIPACGLLFNRLKTKERRGKVLIVDTTSLSRTSRDSRLASNSRL